MKRLAAAIILCALVAGCVETPPPEPRFERGELRVKLNEYQDRQVLLCWSEGFDTRIESEGEGGTEIACVGVCEARRCGQ